MSKAQRYVIELRTFCPTCQGSGAVRQPDTETYDKLVSCEICRGRGSTSDETFWEKDINGRLVESEHPYREAAC